jgi:predicted Zn-dependent protease with MMP-like domain
MQAGAYKRGSRVLYARLKPRRNRHRKSTSMAQSTDPALVWRDRHSPSLEDFERLAEQAYQRLPAEFRSYTGEILLRVAEFPDEEVLEELDFESPFELLGLFEGRGVADKVNPYTGELPNRITLYRRPILDYWAENEETLGHLITHVLVHEIGHHFGLSDEDIEDIEAQAG